jgi:hypothetical protein
MDPPKPIAAPPRPNRLSIAHLFLWTATTAVVLTHQQSLKPASPGRIGFSSFLSTPGMDVEVEKANERRRIHGRWTSRWFVDLAFSPVYGAALAGVVLAVWRLITFRFGFPSQPGHWLLILICMLYWIVALRFFLEAFWGTNNQTDLGVVLGMAASAAIVTFVMWKPLRWSLASGLTSLGFAAFSLAIVSVMKSSAFEPLPPFMIAATLALMFLSSGLLLALLSAVVDLYEELPYDSLHWIGVITVLGVLGHFVLILIVH